MLTKLRVALLWYQLKRIRLLLYQLKRIRLPFSKIKAITSRWKKNKNQDEDDDKNHKEPIKILNLKPKRGAFVFEIWENQENTK